MDTAQFNLTKLAQNLYTTATKYNSGFSQLIQKQATHEYEGDMHQKWIVMQSFFRALQNLYAHPDKIVDHTFSWIKDYMKIYNEALSSMLDNKSMVNNAPYDPRFSDEEWQSNPIFNFIQTSYILNQNWVCKLLKELDGLDPKDLHKVSFYTKSILDAMAPSNFSFINPAVIKATITSNGENLIDGADNFLEDVNRAGSSFSIASTDFNAFSVGGNLAVTSGQVVFQNDLMQLIQYTPSTPDVHQIPLIIMPAWINKFYILDLQEKNSFVKWIVEQGYTVFMISWVTPEAAHAHKDFADYMLEGPLAAMEVVKKITLEKKVNMVGYCLGGTLLAATSAYLEAKNDNTINSLTFLTTLIDFAESGDLSVFIDEEQLQMMESRMAKNGYLSGSEMASTFSMLRANDMIWSFYVNNYLLGKDPLPFDILYWNADSTRLPAAMHSFYLRNMYQNNLLKLPEGITLNNVAINLQLIQAPIYMLAAQADHIVPWKSAFSAMHIYKSKMRFVLSDSGHVAGVVNHPSRHKYCYWTYDKSDIVPQHIEAEQWLNEATQHPGSWWDDWSVWLGNHSGPLVKARKINMKTAIEPAPGSYVKKKALD